MRKEEDENPFNFAVSRELISSWEFDQFRQNAQAKIEAAAERNQRLQQLKRFVGFYVDDTDKYRVQVWFGVHRRRKLDGKILRERGAALVYSMPFVGAGSATTLYPAESEDNRVVEDRIYIRMGNFSGANMLNWIEKDLASLTAYAHVSSADGSPMLRERLRVWWLRKLHPMSKDGKHLSPSAYRKARYLIKFIGGKIVESVLQPFVIFIVFSFFVYLGFSKLAEIILG